MYGDKNNSMQCVEFDALLAEALDGTLTGSKLESFEEHKQGCATCAAMFAEAEAGMKWLNVLDEVEPPRMLVHNILAATSGTPVATGIAEVAARRPWWQQIRDRLSPQLAPVFTPRFAMSFGMAFFSITMVMNVTGVKVANVRHLDLSPRGIQKTYYASQNRVVRYYENIRLVYEIESKVRELKRATDDGSYKDQKQQGPEKQQKKENNSEREPDLRQYQNYSRETNATVMARTNETIQQAGRRRDV